MSSIPLLPVSVKPLLLMALLTLVFPVGIATIALAVVKAPFNWPVWGAVAAISIATTAVLFFYMRRGSLDLTSDRLIVRSAFYTAKFPRAQIRKQDVAVIDMKERTALKPTLRTNGVGLPGYLAGWFRLKNGDKGFLYVTNPREVVYLPTTTGTTILINVAHPDTLAEQFSGGHLHDGPQPGQVATQ